MPEFMSEQERYRAGVLPRLLDSAILAIVLEAQSELDDDEKE